MRFYNQRRVAPAIPIVSLIDILSILLVFFIVTMSFPEKKSHLTIALPKAGKNLTGKASTERRMTISLKNKDEVWLADQQIPLAGLGEALRQLKAADPSVKLELMADESLPLGTLVTVWDAFNKAGISIKEVPARIQLQEGS